MTQEVKLRRAQCNYQSENARFLMECDFSKQYSHYYCKRLEKTRPFIEINCRFKWGSSIPIYGLAQLAEISGGDAENDSAGADSSQSSFSSSSSSSHNPPNAQIYCNFKFSKRIRRHSENNNNNNPKQSPFPQTSTQRTNVEPVACDGIVSPIIPVKSQLPPGLVHLGSPSSQHHNSEDNSQHQCIVIGTIFKRMKLQPDVVRELSQGDFHVKCDRYLGHYTSQDDKLVLEDADESISLQGNINPKDFVTGVVVALLGKPINDGSQFLVRDICYAEPNRQSLYDESTPTQEEVDEVIIVERPLEVADTKPIYLMIVSGLGFHQDMMKRSILTKALQDLIDFVWGGKKYSDDPRSSQVSRILVAGDNLLETRLDDDDDEQSRADDDVATKMKQSRQVKQYKGSVQAVKHMDDFFAQLSKTINVDVMPGASDPSSHLMPQQPFHPCMFPKSCKFSTFNCTTNPHHAKYNDNVEILATSGQNIDIISSFSGIDDPIEIMKCHLKWGNSAPSAPDNLYSVPYEEDDPHVIDFIPEVYVAGCQASYRTDYYCYTTNQSELSINHSQEKIASKEERVQTTASQQSMDRQANFSPSSNDGKDAITTLRATTQKSRTLLVTVPKFCETFSCVLINLKNLESCLLSFR